MEFNTSSQDQSANVDRNDYNKNVDNVQNSLEKGNLEMESDKLYSVDNISEKMPNDIYPTNNELSSHSDKKHQADESVEINIGLSVGKVSEVLDNQKSKVPEAVTGGYLENIKGKSIDEMDDAMCVIKGADKEETQYNIGRPSESLYEKQIHVPENFDVTHDTPEVLNNNKKTECFTNIDENIVGTAKGVAIAGASEMLVKEVTKLNISSGEKTSRGTASKVVVNKQTESLKSIMAYDGDSDSEHSDQAEVCDLSSDDEENNTNTKKSWRKNKDHASGTSDSESDSSASTLSLESDSDREISEGDSASVIDTNDKGDRVSAAVNKNGDKGAVKKKNPNILDLEEFLPPLPDLSKLNINIDEADFMHIGRISAIISELVTVIAIPGTPAFDLDSMLFTDKDEKKMPIGPIYDVLGPVSEPFYCVRFNSEKEIRDMGLKSGMKVYAVPKNEEFTKYVFVHELMKIKGSDASWFNDTETPSELVEFSDDEKEREARRAKKTSMKRKLNDGSLERHKRYELTMNQCNSLNTRVCRLMDAQKNVSKHIRPNTDDVKPHPGCLELPSVPPLLFDPTVPPPGFGQTAPYGMSTQPPALNTSPGFGQSPNFNNSLSPYSSDPGPGSFYDSQMLFGHHYPNEPPPPQNVCPPPARWSWKSHSEETRRPHRSNNPRPNQHNLDNYFTNNGRKFRGAGPSSQPF